MGNALHAAATAPWVQSLALLCLCAAFLQGGVDKVRDFRGAVAEMRQFGLAPAAPIAVATIALQLGASALIVSGWYRWAGALALAAFTVIAAFLADRFWLRRRLNASAQRTHFLNIGAWSAACCSSPGTI